MYNNGTSHLTANDDLSGICHILKWLSFIPKKRDEKMPVLISTDESIDRDVDFYPESSQYDVRSLLGGASVDGIHLSGLFDRDSFFETLGGWAKSVVVGRARLGGIPCGVIAVETRIVSSTIPADPAS